MRRRNNLKAVAPPDADKLSYREVERLAAGLASDLMSNIPPTGGVLMVLMQEISNHPFDPSHVEMVANHINSRLFAWTQEADDAEQRYIALQRAKYVGEGGAA